MGHIADKELLYSKVLNWLNQGVNLWLVNTFMGGTIQTIPQNMLSTSRTEAINWSLFKNMAMCLKRSALRMFWPLTKPQFISILKMEMNKFKPIKDQFIKEFSLKDYKDLTDGCDIKVERCSKGEQGWGHFKARK